MIWQAAKSAVKRAAPWLVPAYSFFCWNFIIRPKWRQLGMTGVFEEHYQNNAWGSKESVSGEGSTVEATTVIRQSLPGLITEFGIRTMLDIPCGDFNWMKYLDLPVQYIGADIVDELVALNQDRFTSATKSFVKLDLSRGMLPAVDLVLCRDCLVHFSIADIFEALDNIKRSGSRFLLTTTNPKLSQNRDIVTGEWRRLNLEAPPFSLPSPVKLIDELCSNPAAQDKHLGLWRVDDIR